MRPRVHKYWTPDYGTIYINRRSDKRLYGAALTAACLRDSVIIPAFAYRGSADILANDVDSADAEISFDSRELSTVINAITVYASERPAESRLQRRSERLLGALMLVSPNSYKLEKS